MPVPILSLADARWDGGVQFVEADAVTPHKADYKQLVQWKTDSIPTHHY
jgi:hypothetical protein